MSSAKFSFLSSLSSLFSTFTISKVFGLRNKVLKKGLFVKLEPKTKQPIKSGKAAFFNANQISPSVNKVNISDISTFTTNS